MAVVYSPSYLLSGSFTVIVARALPGGFGVDHAAVFNLKNGIGRGGHAVILHIDAVVLRPAE